MRIIIGLGYFKLKFNVFVKFVFIIVEVYESVVKVLVLIGVKLVVNFNLVCLWLVIVIRIFNCNRVKEFLGYKFIVFLEEGI